MTLVKPGGPTAATGKIEVGDRILTVDGADLMGREMQHVIRPADKHVLVVEKHEGEGSTQAARGRVLLAAAEAAARPLPPSAASSPPPEALLACCAAFGPGWG